MMRRWEPSPHLPFSSCTSMSNHIFLRSMLRRRAVAVTFMPTGVGARWRQWISAPTVVIPSSRYALASSRAAASMRATMLGVDRILDPALPMRLAVISSVTSQVRLYSVGFSMFCSSL